VTDLIEVASKAITTNVNLENNAISFLSKTVQNYKKRKKKVYFNTSRITWDMKAYYDLRFKII